MDIKKASDPDKLPPKLFKFCAHAFPIPLHIIYNQSMKSGKFPCRWKKANATPIHKSGSTHDANNYRPISKLCIAAKVLDCIIADEVFEKFKNPIVPQQHGFSANDQQSQTCLITQKRFRGASTEEVKWTWRILTSRKLSTRSTTTSFSTN